MLPFIVPICVWKLNIFTRHRYVDILMKIFIFTVSLFLTAFSILLCRCCCCCCGCCCVVYKINSFFDGFLKLCQIISSQLFAFKDFFFLDHDGGSWGPVNQTGHMVSFIENLFSSTFSDEFMDDCKHLFQ